MAIANMTSASTKIAAVKAAGWKITTESLLIIVIGLADLLTTIIFIRSHGAQEANPLFQQYWEMGLAAFILAKLVCLLGPLLILEWARKSNPKFVRLALRGAIAGYVIMYGIGFFRLNMPKAAAGERPSMCGLECAQLYAASSRRAEEQVLLRAQGLPRVPRMPPALSLFLVRSTPMTRASFGNPDQPKFESTP